MPRSYCQLDSRTTTNPTFRLCTPALGCVPCWSQRLWWHTRATTGKSNQKYCRSNTEQYCRSNTHFTAMPQSEFAYSPRYFPNTSEGNHQCSYLCATKL